MIDKLIDNILTAKTTQDSQAAFDALREYSHANSITNVQIDTQFDFHGPVREVTFKMYGKPKHTNLDAEDTSFDEAGFSDGGFEDFEVSVTPEGEIKVDDTVGTEYFLSPDEATKVIIKLVTALMTLGKAPALIGDRKKLGAAFNEWLRRYTENPEKFAREFQTVAEFQKQTAAGVEPDYGQSSIDYLTKLVVELSAS